jgi:hypothetical protein
MHILHDYIVNSPPPRNFVAKNAKTAGSGAHSDKSKTIPRHEKHKTNFKESEGSPEGMPHVSKKLLQHIVQQIGTDGVKALIKSLKWGDGAAGELLTLITQNLKKSAQEMKESSLQEKILLKRKSVWLSQPTTLASKNNNSCINHNRPQGLLF